MTTQRTFKRRVRSRMAKTGESYAAARRRMLPPDVSLAAPVPPWKPSVSNDALIRRTGRPWEEWFAMLDAWDGRSHTHREIVDWLHGTHEVSAWWAQNITVGFEQARGMRAPGQKADGWAVTASKTVAVPIEQLFESMVDAERRDEWLPDAPLTLRTATPPKSARFDWMDGQTRVAVGFLTTASGGSQIAIQHERLPDAATADLMKVWWRERVAHLKDLLEAEPV